MRTINTCTVKGAVNVATVSGKLGAAGISGLICIGSIDYGGDAPLYTGDYTVTPKTHSQTLDTENKKLLQDVTIKAVPYYETSNSKGKTVYIAMEV